MKNKHAGSGTSFLNALGLAALIASPTLFASDNDDLLSIPFSRPITQSKQLFDSNNMERVSDLTALDPIRAPASATGYLQVRIGNEEKKGCTLFLVGKDLAITNWHCVTDKKGKLADNKQMQTWFDYLLPDDKGERGPRVKKILVQDKTLDFALLQLTDDIGTTRGWMVFDLEAHNTVQNVLVVQHSANREKHVARQDNAVTARGQDFIHYRADTLDGSAGSPVLSGDGGSLIAIHHASAKGYNEGIPAAAIYPLVKDYVSVKPPCSNTTATPSASVPVAPAVPDTAAITVTAATETPPAKPEAKPAFVDKCWQWGQ